MSDRTILICDDQEEQEAVWLKALKDADYVDFEVQPLKPDDDFEEALSALRKRKSRARQIHSSEAVRPDEIPDIDELSGAEKEAVEALDNASIVFIDYDLLDLRDFATGEDVAYLARCYSTCGLIVALNRYNFGKVTFDLTLRGHPDSFADLNISSKLIETDYQGLWKEPWEDHFRPWSYPLLPKALDQFETRVEELEGHVDDEILDYFGIRAEVADSMPRSAIEFLTEGDSLQGVTFRDFVKKSGQGVKEEYGPLAEESIRRIAAARISHWLEQVVLPGQNILVDAPHLVSRYPSLLGEDRVDDIRAWDNIATLREVEELEIDYEKIEEERFERSNTWLSRPTWYWRLVSENEEIREVREPWAVDYPKYIFCEDTSRFVTSKDKAREFVADLDSPFVRRYVKEIDEIYGEPVVYKPRVRFSISSRKAVA